ncbi:MAG TPA: hypothetical protein VHA52_09965 [Candidatus Babeliaceae bacterium]|nr:hypothetical protein [Candidatus Babeliaceae bacterium]
MTNLLNQFIPSQFGNLLTLNNQDNLGFQTNLQAVQDGYGNFSPLELSPTQVNINSTQGLFSLNGTPLTASGSQLNNAAQGILQSGSTGDRPANPGGVILYFNTDLQSLQVYNGTTWLTVS